MSVKFQADASQQGRLFEMNCKTALEMAGLEITHTYEAFDDVGVDVDFIAQNRHGISFLVNCAGSWNLNRPGWERTDTVRKKIAEAFLLSLSDAACHFPPMVCMTSHLPQQGRGLAMVRRVPRSVVLAVITDRDTAFLRWLSGATDDDVRRYVEQDSP